MLTHRSGTLYEDMYWIDLDTLKVVAEEINSPFESEIVYTAKMKEEISNILTTYTAILWG